MASGLSEILKSINKKTGLLSEDFIKQEYVPFVVNKSFSYFVDTALLAHEIDQYPEMPVYDQYKFYYYSVEKRSRFCKWHKSERNKYLQAVSEIYNYSNRKSMAALNLLTDKQCETIVKCIYKGGKE